MFGRSIDSFCKYNKVVIIGSSPILLIAALAFARRGKNVIVISEQKNWGGSWQYLDCMGRDIDTSCHLLESYKLAHHVLRKYNINLTPCRGTLVPIKLIPSKCKRSFKISHYHCRVNIAKEIWSKVLALCKLLFLIIVEPSSATKRTDLTRSFFDFLLFVRYRLIQILFLEPICWPVGGWPSLVKELTSQLKKVNITVVDDRVMYINDGKNFSGVIVHSGPPIKADLIVSGQSTLMNSPALNLCNRTLSKGVAVMPRVYTHFLVEVINLPGNLNLPLYIHLPHNEEIHRVTYSHPSSSGFFCLVQARQSEISISTLIHHVKSILIGIIVQSLDKSCHSSAFKESLLEVRVHDKFMPTALHHADAIHVNPGLTGRHLILRTYGDLARNIVHHAQLFS